MLQSFLQVVFGVGFGVPKHLLTGYPRSTRGWGLGVEFFQVTKRHLTLHRRHLWLVEFIHLGVGYLAGTTQD